MSGGNNVLINNVDLEQAQSTSSLQNIGKDGNRTVEEYLPNDDFEDIKMSSNLNDQTKIQDRKTIQNAESVCHIPQPEKEVHKALQTATGFFKSSKFFKSHGNNKGGEQWLTLAKDWLKNYVLEAISDGKTDISGELERACKDKGFFNEIFLPFYEARSENIKNNLYDLFKAYPKFQDRLYQNALTPTDHIRKDFFERHPNANGEALDTLLEFNKYLSDEQQQNLEITTGSWLKEKLKNVLASIKGLFSKTAKQERFKELDAQLNHMKQVFHNNKNLRERILVDVMNDTETSEATQKTAWDLFSDDPDFQDELFKSLRKPMTEFRVEFWNRHREEIESGRIFGFGQDQNPYGIYGEPEIKRLFFDSENKYPLAKLFLTMAEARPDLDKSIFANKKNWLLMLNDADKKRYMQAACSLTKEQVIQSLEDMHEIEYDNTAEDQSENIETVLNFLKDPKSNKIGVNRDSLNTLVVKDTLRNMHYSFVFGRTKIDLSNLDTDEPEEFFKTLKAKLWDNQEKCLLNENQLKQLVNFVFYSPSQGYLASQLDDVVYKPFGGNMPVQVSFDEKKGPVVTIKSKNAYDSSSFINPLDLSGFEELGFKPYVHTSGTLKLTYEKPIDVSNANEYKISVEDYNDYITFESPQS